MDGWTDEEDEALPLPWFSSVFQDIAVVGTCNTPPLFPPPTGPAALPIFTVFARVLLLLLDNVLNAPIPPPPSTRCMYPTSDRHNVNPPRGSFAVNTVNPSLFPHPPAKHTA